MKTITVRANEVSQPYYAGAGSRITLTGSGRVEWAAVEKLQDALNGATWNTWPAGSTAGYRDTDRGMAIRVVGTGACVVTVEEGKADRANENAYWQGVGDNATVITDPVTGRSEISAADSTLLLPAGVTDLTLGVGGGGGGGSIYVLAKSIAGVDATGVTDSTAALNAALAALPPGGVLYFEPGTYTAALRMTVPNTTISGSWAATIKTPSGATSHVNDACVRVVADGCVVENVSLDGNKAGNPAIDNSTDGRQSDGVGIYANRVTVRGCRIYDTIGHKIIVWNQEFAPTGTAAAARSYFTIANNHITGFSYRASIDVASTDVTAEVNNNGVIVGNFVDGNMLIVHTGYDLLFADNVVMNSGAGGEGGISIHTNSKRVRCVNNVIGPGSFGLSTTNNCESIAFVGNKIYNTTGAAIMLASGTNLSADNNLIQTTGGGSAGIQVITATGASVRGNTIIGVGSHSVHLTTASSNVQISGNKSVSPASYHVEIAGNSDISVRGNKFSGGSMGVVATSGTNTEIVIADNDIKGTSSTAINVTAAGTLISGNSIRSSGSHAIRISGQDTRAIGNDIDGVSGNGVTLLAAVTGVTITDNRLRNTSNTPITGMQPDTIVRRNVGYVTESLGNATIADGSSTIVVAHGLKTTPNAVTVTARGNEGVWVSARSSASFTVSRAGTTGALIVDWQAAI